MVLVLMEAAVAVRATAAVVRVVVSSDVLEPAHPPRCLGMTRPLQEVRVEVNACVAGNNTRRKGFRMRRMMQV